MIHAIGLPGQPVRVYLETIEAAYLTANVQDGEVACEVAALPDRGGAPQRLSADGLALVPVEPTLDELRARHWAAAKAYRDLTINGGCPTSFGRVDSDEKSRGYMRDALAAESEDLRWKMADNSRVPLTPAELVAMTREVGLWVTGCQDAAQDIGEAIEAAADAAALEAIDITAGYPAQAGA